MLFQINLRRNFGLESIFDDRLKIQKLLLNTHPFKSIIIKDIENKMI